MEQKKPAASKGAAVYQTGENVFLEGDLGQEMYIVKSGKVDVIREMGDSEIVLTSMKQSEFFGEMALFGEPRRSATVRAAEKTELLVITKIMLESQFKKVPEWLVVMIKTIAQRILSTTRGVKARFPLGMDYSILSSIILLALENGSPGQQENSYTMNLNLTRIELEDILGISLDDIDGWLKKFNFVNLIKMLSSKQELIILDIERLMKYTQYLEMKVSGKSSEGDMDKNTFASFERIHKLLSR